MPRTSTPTVGVHIRLLAQRESDELDSGQSRTLADTGDLLRAAQRLPNQKSLACPFVSGLVRYQLEEALLHSGVGPAHWRPFVRAAAPGLRLDAGLDDSDDTALRMIRVRLP